MLRPVPVGIGGGEIIALIEEVGGGIIDEQQLGAEWAAPGLSASGTGGVTGNGVDTEGWRGGGGAMAAKGDEESPWNDCEVGGVEPCATMIVCGLFPATAI